MTPRLVPSDYVERALGLASYDKLADASFAGRIPPCTGVIALGTTLYDCQGELKSTLEGWILLGLKLGHQLPVIEGLDLNRQLVHEPVEDL